MRQVPNGKRSRNRPGRHNRQSNPRNQTYDSSGPEGKVRGTANQVYEKYLALARDAQSSGDRIGAENFFQHAEHYFRILAANGQQMRPRPMNGFEDDFGEEDGDTPGGAPDRGEQPQQGPQASQPLSPSPEPTAGTGNGHGPSQARPETPAQLAQAAAANQDGRPSRERGRRGRRPASEDAGAEATS